MTHPIDLFSAKALSELRDISINVQVENNAQIVPGIYFSWDSEAKGTRLGLMSEPGMLASVELEVPDSPRWLVLNLALGNGDISAGDVLGIVADIKGLNGNKMLLFVRTACEGAFSDTQIPDPLEGSEDPAIRVLLYTVQFGDPITKGEGYHTLVLELPKQNGTLTINNLRFFVLPAARNLRSMPPTLANFT